MRCALRLASVAAALLSFAFASAAAERPNVILIISDDHGFPDYGFMGNAAVRTPSLDRIASQGILYTRGYVTTALCSPSLAALLTGLYPHQSGITGNDLAPVKARRIAGEAAAGGRRPLIDRLLANPLLPRMLTDAGYRTLQTGKLWNVGFREAGFTDGMTRPGGRHGGEGLSIGREGLQPIYDFIAAARAEKKPFFVWYAPFLPHEPHTPPARLLAKYQGKGPTPKAEKYYAMVEWLDETCGELDDYLRKNSLSDNTVVMYLADNGWDAAQGTSGSRAKLAPYDLGVRTPMFFRWPGRVKPERDDKSLASIVDFVPTILTACGVKLPEGLPGVNLLDRQAVAARRSIFLENFGHDIQDIGNPAASLLSRGVIDGCWKLMVAPPGASQMPGPKELLESPVELYNLKEDPLETTNLAAKEPDRVAALRKTIDDWWNPQPVLANGRN